MRMRSDSAAASGGGSPMSMTGWPRQGAEDQRDVETVAGAEDAAHARRGPGQLVQVGAATGRGLGLGEVQRGHAEQPVGVDQFMQLVRARLREGLPVAARAVGPGREDAQRRLRLLPGDLAELSGQAGEQPVFVTVVTDDQLDIPAGALGQGLPRRDRQDVAIDDRGERDGPVGDLTPASGRLAHLGADRIAGGGQRGRVDPWTGLPTVGRSPSSAAQADGDVGGELGARRTCPGTLWATARRKSPAAPGMASSAATEPPPADSPKTVTRSGVAAEGGDVVAHPLQRGDLVEQAPVGGRPLDAGQTPPCRRGS